MRSRRVGPDAAPRRVLRDTTAFHVSAFVLILILLNGLLTAYRWLPSRHPLGLLVPGAETGVAVLALALFLGRRWPRWLVWLPGAVVGALLAFSWAEAFYQFYYQRPFIPWTDVPFVAGGLLLVFGSIEEWLTVATIVTIVIILSVAVMIAWLALRGLVASGRRIVPPWAFAAIGCGLILASFAAERPGDWLTVRAAMAAPRPTIDEAALHVQSATPSNLEESGAESRGFPGFGGRDVHLFFVESYGQTVFENPTLSAPLIPVIQGLESELKQAGYLVMSTFLESPVVGGYSWIAEAALLTGAEIGGQAEYTAAIEAGIPTLPGIMRDHGYFTLLSMPGTVHGEWPEASSFYRFEEIMLAPEFDYTGPMFSFVPIPDQIAIFQSYQRLIADRRSGSNEPAYVQYILVSSHTPFSRIPPYIPDWYQLGDGSEYNELSIATFDNDWLSGNEFEKGYVAAVTYSLTTVVRFLTSVVREDVVAVVLGDHQPGPQLRLPGAPKSVPIHVITRDPDIASAFQDRGFEPGMIPAKPLPHDPMSSFLPRFLSIASGRPPGNPQNPAPQ